MLNKPLLPLFTLLEGIRAAGGACAYCWHHNIPLQWVKINLSNELETDLKLAKDSIKKGTWADTKPRTEENPSRIPAWITDAGPEYYGVVKITETEIPVFTGKWTDTNISQAAKELEAAKIATKWAKNDDSIWTDAAGLVLAYKKGYSKCENVNTWLAEVRSKNIKIGHVTGRNNPADNPSRGKKVSAEIIQRYMNDESETNTKQASNW